MNAQSIEPIEFLKILGHDMRWAIVTTLAHSDHKVQELVERLQQPQNLVSYHLKQLRASHLVSEHRSTADGRDVYYSLDLPQLQAAFADLGVALHPAFAVKSGSITANVNTHPETTSKRSIRVLFLCTENSARSQIAEALLRHFGDNSLEVYSAGTTPSYLHPLAIHVMVTRGIDTGAQRAKSVDEFHGQAFDYVITVCDRAREQCPTFADGTVFIHWSLPDPASVTGKGGEAQSEAFEQAARELERRVQYFLAAIRNDSCA